MSLAAALRLHRAGRLPEAERLYRLMLERSPRNAEALHLLGLLYGQTGRMATSADLIRRAIEARPGNPEAWCNLGISLSGAGKPEEAVRAFRRAVELQPDYAAAWFKLGTELAARGTALLECEMDEAISALRKAIGLKPDHAAAWCNLGAVLRDKGDIDGAMAALESALHLKPDDAAAHLNLGTVFHEQAKFDEAIQSYRRALDLGGNSPELHTDLGMELLRAGDFERGWREYEWRLKLKNSVQPRDLPQPLWDGRDLDGKRILIFAEQGFGDSLQFLRYLPKVVKKGGRVILQMPPGLVRLCQQSWDLERVVAPEEPPGNFDVYCPLLSLPRLFQTSVTAIPAEVPYLKPSVAAVELWHRRVAEHGGRLRVGLCWASERIRRGRSIPWDQLQPLAEAGDIVWFSLMKGRAADAANPPGSMKLIEEEKRDFADTAALIANLDLVISVDTAVAHLAGALGVPVWVMLPRVADWRWLLGRDDSPWYPSMRLFRQENSGKWRPVIERIAACLSSLSQDVLTYRVPCVTG